MVKWYHKGLITLSSGFNSQFRNQQVPYHPPNGRLEPRKRLSDTCQKPSDQRLSGVTEERDPHKFLKVLDIYRNMVYTTYMIKTDFPPSVTPPRAGHESMRICNRLI